MMPTPQERIAAGQELRKRGRLSPEQDAALSELERRYGGGQRLQGSAGMVEQGTISREQYMRERGGVGFNGQPLPAQDYGTAPSSPPMTFVDEGTLGLQKGMAKGDIERFNPSVLDQPMDTGARTKMPRSQSVAIGVTDFNPVRYAMGNRGFTEAKKQSLQDNPLSTRGGQTLALASGGGAQLYNAGMKLAPKLVAPAVAARFATNTLRDQGIRYAGRLGTMMGLGALDYAGYNILAESPNQALVEDRAPPTIGERLQFAGQEATKPSGILAAAAPGAGSLLYRTARGGLAAGKNVLASGTARGVTSTGQQAPITNLLTPKDVQARVNAVAPTLRTMNKTDAERAIDMLLRRGFDPDEAEKMVRFLDYAGKSEVPEMLFQIMPDLRKVDQLTVALGTVGGDAQKALGDALGKQVMEAPGVLREALRKAMGLSGDDYYAMQKGLRADQLSAPKEGYEAAYAKEVSDETWTQKILPQLRTKYGREAVSDAADYAEGIAGTDPVELAVARQLAELRDALDSPGATPGKISTQSIDYIDRMLGDMAQGIKQGKGRQELAKGPVGAQRSIRGDANSGLDVETGLGDPRRLSAELKTAQDALEFGRTAFRNGTDIETLQDEFAGAIAKLGQEGSDSETIRGALLMGWLRGAEDEISKATNPGSVIRRIYGSERQRTKLLSMMPEVDEAAGAGTKGSNTKNIRALIGGRREDGREMQGMIDRLRRVSNDYNRIIGNAQSAQRLEAVAEQGGAQDKLNFLFDAFINTRQAAVNVARMAVNRVSRPGIYEPGVNRELGRILTARGKKQILSVIDEIRQRQLARSGGTPPASGAPPRPPLSGPPAGGGTVASGFGFNPFGGSKASRPLVLGPKNEVLTLRNQVTPEEARAASSAKRQTVGQDMDWSVRSKIIDDRSKMARMDEAGKIQKVLDERRAALGDGALEREASMGEWRSAIEEAEQRINREYGRRYRNLGGEVTVSSRGPQDYRTTISEELADIILRERGIDPTKAKAAWLRPRRTNQQAEELRAQRTRDRNEAQERRDSMTDQDYAIEEFEDDFPDIDLVGFLRRAVAEERLNMPAEEMSSQDIISLAGRYAKRFDRKKGQGATELERIGKLIWENTRFASEASEMGFGASLRQDLGNTAAGAISGGIMPMPSTGDPEQDMRNRLGMMAAGAGAGFAGRRLSNAFAPQARSMGAGGGGRKPPKDSPEAIRAGVEKMVEQLRAASANTPRRPPGQLIAPRGGVRGAIVPPDRAAARAAAQAAREAAMAQQVPPPLPALPPRGMLPVNRWPTSTEGGLMAGTATALGATALMERINQLGRRYREPQPEGN